MPFSEREQAILRLVTRNSTAREIAGDLGLTEAAVNVHLTQLYQKLGVKDRSQARIWARDHGWSIAKPGEGEP